MMRLLRDLWRLLRFKFARYLIATAIAVLASQLLLAIFYGLLRWSAVRANLLATVVVTGPAFFLNRAWVWRRNGPTRFIHEVVPFWAIAFTGFAVSTIALAWAGREAPHITANRSLETLLIVATSCASYVLVWLGRYFLLDRAVFRRS